MRADETIDRLSKQCEDCEQARILAEARMELASRLVRGYRDENRRLRERLVNGTRRSVSFRFCDPPMNS